MGNLEQFPRYKNADVYVPKSRKMLRRIPSFEEIDHKFYIFLHVNYDASLKKQQVL